jgi:hypothetical protein
MPTSPKSTAKSTQVDVGKIIVSLVVHSCLRADHSDLIGSHTSYTALLWFRASNL